MDDVYSAAILLRAFLHSNRVRERPNFTASTCRCGSDVGVPPYRFGAPGGVQYIVAMHRGINIDPVAVCSHANSCPHSKINTKSFLQAITIPYQVQHKRTELSTNEQHECGGIPIQITGTTPAAGEAPAALGTNPTSNLTLTLHLKR